MTADMSSGHVWVSTFRETFQVAVLTSAPSSRTLGGVPGLALGRNLRRRPRASASYSNTTKVVVTARSPKGGLVA